MDKFRPESFLPLTPVAFEILLALADGERHGYSILQEVETRSGGAVSLHAGTLVSRAGPAARKRPHRRAASVAGSVERRRAAALLPADRARHRRGARGSGAARGTTGGRPHPPTAERRARESASPRLRRTRVALFSLALLAYPRAFRRRFGDEMRDDFRRTHLRHRRHPRHAQARRAQWLARNAAPRSCAGPTSPTSRHICTNRQGGTSCSWKPCAPTSVTRCGSRSRRRSSPR